MIDERPVIDQAAEAERRVLLLPSTRRDADAIHGVCAAHNIASLVVASMIDACEAISEGAATFVVAEESLTASPEVLLDCLGRQPVWSDLPIIVLSRSGSESPKLSRLLERFGNVSVVERPVRISTFLSIVKVALRGRRRQYEVRQHLRQIQAGDAERTALWESERSARSEAERAGRMKDEFLATLSHEIRTPLNAILGWAHILVKNAPGEKELAKGLEIIERNARSQSQIVADLLDMNRIINGKVRLDIKRLLLPPVIHAATDTVTPAAQAKGVRLELLLDPAAGPVSGDLERLQQVFWNLLSNAVKFTPKGGEIRVVLETSGSHLHIRVIDTGDGIEPDFLPHVFDRFRQADGSTSRRHGGLGLGLAIVKQLVELHGGSVLASSPGRDQGSTFTVTLPTAVAAPHDDDTQEHAHTTAGAIPPAIDTPSDLSNVRALCVDDEPDSRDLVRRLLESRDAVVSTASSAEEALDQIATWRPNVLISDIGMPGEDGYSLIRRIRQLPAELGGNTVAIDLTAYARTEDRLTALNAGFQHHIAKPVDPRELLAIVAAAVRPPR